MTFTSGVRDSGAAATHPQSSIAGITIEGGNKPHGVVSVSLMSREVRVLEDAGEVGVNIDRKFGAIGEISRCLCGVKLDKFSYSQACQVDPFSR